MSDNADFIVNWIDDLAEVWACAVNDFQTVTSRRIVSGADFANINPTSNLPIAMTMVTGVSPMMAASGSRLFWTGETHFYVEANTDNAKMPSLPKWYALILRAAAAHKTLNGKAEDFSIPDEEDAITFSALQYNDDTPPQWGFVVKWTVTELAAIEVTP